MMSFTFVCSKLKNFLSMLFRRNHSPYKILNRNKTYSVNRIKDFLILVSNRFLVLMPRSIYRASLISGKISAPSSNLLSSSYPTVRLDVLPILLSVHLIPIVGPSNSVPLSLPSFLATWMSNLWPNPRKLRSLNDNCSKSKRVWENMQRYVLHEGDHVIQQFLCVC